jgi:hypothetical protein
MAVAYSNPDTETTLLSLDKDEKRTISKALEDYMDKTRTTDPTEHDNAESVYEQLGWY